MIANLPSAEVVEHLVLDDVSWEAYERLLEAFGRRRLRHVYDTGRLEVTSRLRRFEIVRKTLSRIVDTAACELNRANRGLGSVTYQDQSKQKGIVADEGYYFQPNHIRLPIDDDSIDYPPPDLAIDIAVTYVDFDREAVYACWGVPELWYFDASDGSIRILVLQSGRYESVPASHLFPEFDTNLLRRWIDLAFSTCDHNDVIRDLLSYLKSQGFTTR